MTSGIALTCPDCQWVAQGDASFCMQCGAPLTDEVARGSRGLPDSLPAQLASATLGEYQVVGELGHGGMASVFLAEDLALGRQVAIKVMTPGLEATAGMADRFLQEARTAAQLSHPNIIPIYAVRTTGELRFFVMKYVPGRPLDRVLATGPLAVPVVLAILAQVGAALDHAHGRGVIHRDIKPANIMLDEDGQAIVADFGIAKVAQGTGLTQPGSAVGTPTYMSPEQCSGKSVTGASDQYALGCVAFEMLTGRAPFVHQEVMPVMLAHLSDPPPPLLPLRPDCPLSLAGTVERMLAKRPEARWPSVAEAITAAEALLPSDPQLRATLRALAQAPRGSAVVHRPSVPLSPVPPSSRDAPPPVVSGPVLSLTIEPNGAVLQAGAGLRLQALARDRAGLPVHDARMEWHSTSPCIVAVSSAGVITGLSEGVAEISARCEQAGAVVQVRVAPVPVAQLRLSPPEGPWYTGERRRITVAVQDQAGAVLPGLQVRWTSLDPSRASVECDGTVQGLSEGPARIRASCEAQLSELTLEIQAAPGVLTIIPDGGSLATGQVVRLAALWQLAEGETHAAAGASWESSDAEVLRVSGEGDLVAIRPGTAQIRVRHGGRVAEATYLITRVDVASVRILPQISVLGVGEELRLQTQAADRLGSSLPGRLVTWASSHAEVAVVESDGRLRGIGPGSARISASIGAGLASFEIKVTPVALAAIRIEPVALVLRAGEVAQLKAIIQSAHGGLLPGFPVEWVSSDPAIATVDAGGAVSGHRFGTARIAASASGRRATVPVEVRPAVTTSGVRYPAGS